MIEQAIKKISEDIEFLVKNNIEIRRALDILEASTQSLEEIVVINTFRESLVELGDQESNQSVSEKWVAQIATTQQLHQNYCHA